MSQNIYVGLPHKRKRETAQELFDRLKGGRGPRKFVLDLEAEHDGRPPYQSPYPPLPVVARAVAARVNRPVYQGQYSRIPVVQPLDWSRAHRRTSYDPRTIAQDILVTVGKHPEKPGLNSHVAYLSAKYPEVNENADLSTLRWDLIDKRAAREAASMQVIPTQPIETESPFSVVGFMEANAEFDWWGMAAKHPQGENVPSTLGNASVKDVMEANNRYFKMAADAMLARTPYEEMDDHFKRRYGKLSGFDPKGGLNDRECMDLVVTYYQVAAKELKTRHPDEKEEPLGLFKLALSAGREAKAWLLESVLEPPQV